MPIHFYVFTLFPEVFQPYLSSSILSRAIKQDLLQVSLYNIRDWAKDKHHTTDDEPYGGGGGMVMKPEPIFAAVEEVLGNSKNIPIILLTPQGRVFNQQIAYEFAFGKNPYPTPTQNQSRRIALICGRYEGVDERVRKYLVTDEISIGDYVITGGELAALIIIDATTRLIPGVLGDPTGVSDDSHASGLLEYPQYTRPPVFRGYSVPEVLLSGNHARIARWRREQSLLRTMERRPELIKPENLSSDDIEFLKNQGALKNKKHP